MSKKPTFDTNRFVGFDRYNPQDTDWLDDDMFFASDAPKSRVEQHIQFESDTARGFTSDVSQCVHFIK